MRHSMIGMNPIFDEKDSEILAERAANRTKLTGPLVGDWCSMPDGTERRFTHDWGDSIQTTTEQFGLGSFYLQPGGKCDYSGALDPSIKKSMLEPLHAQRLGQVWFFHHDYHTAHNAVYDRILFDVYRVKK